MTASMPGVEAVRALLHPAQLRETVSTSGGYLDVLAAGEAPAEPERHSFAYNAMHSQALATVYERAWRPLAFTLATGLTTSTERRNAVADLHLSGEQRVLDVACGPGNFTHYLSERLSGDGVAVGFDISKPMLRRAVADNSGARVGYVRGDAGRLPFADNTFDAVCCFGALYLMPDPFTALDEMVRVLAPGGRIAIMTSYQGDVSALRPAVRAGSGLIGLRVFGRDTIPDVFAGAGLTDVEQRLRRVVQYVNATKPQS
ncbi:class I SAM-dependent methyltransferase [Aldersonia kunmingensis]|uniref:class I SAM-dependent methyltransferase n=1 Tax=Aldersonia kunmingensis TaxID=408066 RepID=UPI00082A0FBA|nr:class I SAM-dependent methyltransferase [Aldersonia kunmingensis]